MLKQALSLSSHSGHASCSDRMCHSTLSTGCGHASCSDRMCHLTLSTGCGHACAEHKCDRKKILAGREMVVATERGPQGIISKEHIGAQSVNLMDKNQTLKDHRANWTITGNWRNSCPQKTNLGNNGFSMITK
jgi:hypothetical protein